jgi:hypothetical protein
MTTPLSPAYVAFDENGTFVDRPSFDGALAAAAAHESPTDVFVLSHGWNNNFADASQTYSAIIGQMTAVADSTPGLRPDPYRPLAFGVIWPSKAWDESAGAALESVGAAGANPHTSSMAESVYDALSPGRASPAGFRHDVLHMQQFLLKDRLNGVEREEFRALLRRHADLPTLPEDESIFEPESPANALEGVTAGDFSARDVFRTFTYWQMKKRAGLIGQTGVRAAVAAVQDRFPTTRVHLIGHSFGCKVVLAAVAGAGAPLDRPVQTIVLLQGAVSYEAMADRVSGTNAPGGYYSALDPDRVDGPIVATFSTLDKACREAYPLGSRLAGQVGELEGMLDRYRALGAVGARGVRGELDHRLAMREMGGTYSFTGRGVWSVDGGTPPKAFITGHSEIRTPQVAWLIWSAVRRR